MPNTTGFSAIAMRDIFYSGIMWTILENVRSELKKRDIIENDIGLT